MSRQIVFLALGMAILGLAVILSSLFTSPQGDPALGEQLVSSIRNLEARLDHLEDTLDSRVRESLQGISSSPFPVGTTSPDTAEGLEQPAEDVPPGEQADEERERMLARFEVLERRIRALEEDPVQRGYNFLESDSASLRRDGIFALERLAQSDPEARQAIRDMLADPDPRVRDAALDTLADIGDKESIALARALLEDPDAGVRRETVETLVRLGDKESALAIAQLLGDPNERVREEAADSLGRLKSPEATNQLLGALQDPNDRVRGEAIASLGEIGAREAIPQLRAIYEKDPGRHRFRLITALRNLGDAQPYNQEVQRLSQNALSGQDDRTKVEALRTLSWLARDQARGVFEQARQDPNPRVREAAERALRGDRDRGRRGR